MFKNLTRKLTDYGNRNSIGSELRRRRMGPLIRLIENHAEKAGHVTILDVGGTDIYWRIMPDKFLETNRVTITIVNLPEERLPEDYGAFRFIQGDGCDLSNISDQEFHIAHSNSVIEHVGDWDRMEQFANEFRRVAKSYFIQTPNYWFPIEPHCMTPFIHWLPKPARVWLVMKFSLGYWQKAESVSSAVRLVESARLLSRKMFSGLFDDAVISTERLLLLPKSFIATR